MLMAERPLWYDLSSHQGEVKFARLAEGPLVSGMYIRAGVGLSKDPTFERNYTKCGEQGLYRTSYWALHPDKDAFTQFETWYFVHPILNGIPRVMDLEREHGVACSIIAGIAKDWSNEILQRDGHRPWIYGRCLWLERVIFPFWTEEFINEHFYILAQYDVGDGKEYEGIVLPDKMRIDRVLFKQTSDEIAPAPLGLAPESAAIDRNRWLLGDEEQMKSYLNALYFEPELPVDCCEELREVVEAEFKLAGKLILDNADEIDTLRQREIEHTREHNADITKLKARADELGVKLDLLGEAVNDNKQDVMRVDVGITNLNKRIDEIIVPETNHSHFWQRWFK